MTYLSHAVKDCHSCVSTSEPKPSRKVSLGTLNRSFNEVVCIDHMHSNNFRVCHVKDTTTRYSFGSIVDDTNMSSVIQVIESQWISHFWAPESMQFDQAFDNSEFKRYFSSYDIECRPIPARRHNKNALESKHRIIRDILLLLNYYINEKEHPLLVQQALRISNDLYGNDVISSHELAKDYTRPIDFGCPPKIIPEEIRKAHDVLKAKRKLTKIMRSKSIRDPQLTTGDLVEVFIKLQNERGEHGPQPSQCFLLTLRQEYLRFLAQETVSSNLQLKM